MLLWRADAIFCETDRVREYKKKIVVILSKIDLLESEKDLQDVMQWVREQSTKLLALENALIFPVSAKKALKAKILAGNSNVAVQTLPQWQESRFGALEEYILKQLSAQERNQLKLKNPLGVAEHIVRKYLKELEARSATIESPQKNSMFFVATFFTKKFHFLFFFVVFAFFRLFIFSLLSLFLKLEIFAENVSHFGFFAFLPV